MARRTLDGHVDAGTASLAVPPAVGRADEPVGGVALPGRCPPVLALAGVAIGIGAAVGLHAVTLGIQVGVTAILAIVLVRGAAWLLRGRRVRRLLAGIGLVPGHPEARATVLAILRIILAAGLIWLAWVAARSWQYGVLVLLTPAVAVTPPRWARRQVRVARLSTAAQSAAWVSIGHLVVANLVIALALLDTARFSFGLWAVHTRIAFVVLCVGDLLLVKSIMSAARLGRHAAFPENYVLAPAGRALPDPASGTVPSSASGTVPSGTESESSGTVTPGAATEVGTQGAARRAGWLAWRDRQLARRRRTAKPAGGNRVRATVASLGVAGAALWVGFVHPGPLLILGAIVVAGAVLAVSDVTRHQAVTMLLAVALGVSALDYMGWRLAVTNWQGWWIAVPLLVAEVLGAIHTLGYQLTVWPWPTPVIEAAGEPCGYEIFVLVPTVNEGVGILRPTIEGCVAARDRYLEQYPDGEVTIVICNDGRVAGYDRWTDLEELADELGVRCVTRTVPGGAKAGNIENVRTLLGIHGGRLMVIFDADQVPSPEFLVKTVPPFADPKVGWVQSGQYYANLDNPVSRWADDQQSMFYNLLCPGKAAMNSAFICGTNVVIRSAALDEIGGLPTDSVTEDFSASIKLHPRWRSIYLTDVLATGLGPLDVPSFLKQQGRWALGTLSTFRTHWRDVMLPKRNGLSVGQRVQYFLAGTHYLCGLRDLLYVLSPVMFVFTGIPAVRTATLSQYMLHFVPYGILGVVGMWYTARGITGVRGVIIGFGSTPALLSSLGATLLNRKKPFAVTSKQRSGKTSYRYLLNYLLPLALCLAALGYATQVHGVQATSLFISLMWICYSIGLLSSFLWLVSADLRTHRAGEAKVLGKLPYPSKLHIRGSVVRPVVNLGVAALVASPVLLGARLASLPIFNPPARPFTITAQQADSRYVGVSLPIQELTSGSAALERNLKTTFSIEGRTQLINDGFDIGWANQLASQGTRPWIVLQFGVFGAKHQAPLNATLPAIYNGVDDTALRRWATEIRDFGKPVFMTVLLQVDKNWAVSSAVANGGIPQDVPKAWAHIQAVFRSAGADNVAWVWSPADPQNDQQYAPPAASIDVVLQDFINYPGTHWGNPRAVLRALAARYPGKPLFVEVAAAGPSRAKAAWLKRLAAAVETLPQIYAVLWHEGGPLLNPMGKALKSWSETSDRRSLAVWKAMVKKLTRHR